MKIINTREDLDQLVGTAEYDEFMQYLLGSTIKMIDVQVYPENYNQTNQIEDKLPPIWEEIEDLSVIERFGFTKEGLIQATQNLAK